MKRYVAASLLAVLSLCLSAHLTFALEGPGKPSGQPTEAKNLWVYRQSVSLGVAEAELGELVKDCQKRGFTINEIQGLLALIAKAKLARLPHRDLLLKLREGLVKNASPELVEGAILEKARALYAARRVVDELLAQGFRAVEADMAVQAVGDSLEAGLSEEAIKKIVRERTQAPPGLPNPSALIVPAKGK